MVLKFRQGAAKFPSRRKLCRAKVKIYFHEGGNFAAPR
jgi:hypothetical protein